MLAAGLDGIDRELDPGRPNDDNLYAVDADAVASRASPPCRRRCCTPWRPSSRTTCCAPAFGNTGTEDYVDYFAGVKAEEFRAWHAQVTDWEVDRYLTLF